MFIKSLKKVGKLILEIGVMSMLRTEEVPEDIEVSVEYRHIEAHKLSVKFPNRISGFPAALYLGEAIRHSPENAYLPFIATLETEPNFISFKIGGRIFLEGASQEVERWILPDGDEPPKVWHWIYRDILRVVSKFVEFLENSLRERMWMNEEF